MVSNSVKPDEKLSVSSKKEKSFSYRVRTFSMQYLAHHPACDKFNNHIFRIGSLFLCVGCTSVFLAFISYTIVFFSMLSFFTSFPYANGIFAAFGVAMALTQVFLKPNNKWIKALMRFSLGIGLGAYTALIVQVSNLSSQIGYFTILIQIALFLLLIPGVFLYNVLRGDSPYLECTECSIRFVEPSCDYYTVTLEEE
ncbi:MAG: hypothetical protein KAU62_15870 [Candidatus Heimdallarchaeota archaeon]|nr:hypothetical protein [Candidatus Heimdallarchaeota archaeon]MCG3257582.1 hypothetical protein [Candidatus Heimdallarchaeota archaeon]MCK4612634.1 hypothetical protein [Candidatus Heimdallarchaeota archaeon]